MALANSRNWSAALAAAKRARHLVPHAGPETLERLKGVEAQIEKLRAQDHAPPPARAGPKEVLDLTTETLSAPNN